MEMRSRCCIVDKMVVKRKVEAKSSEERPHVLLSTLEKSFHH